MFTVLDCTVNEHDVWLVSLAALIALSSMLCFFNLLGRAEECTEQRRRNWISISALSGGLSVWATHFVAMLAYKGPLPFGFDVPLTVLSAAISVIGFWIALNIARTSAVTRVLATAVITLTIAAMHFVGMVGMTVAADIRYHGMQILGGGSVAAVMIWMTLYTFDCKTLRRHKELAAIEMVVAICALHFTAMSATVLEPNPTLTPVIHDEMNGTWLPLAVTFVTFAILLMTVLGVVIDRLLVDMKGFANATLDGIAILRDGRIVDVNSRFAQMLHVEDGAAIGLAPAALLVAADWQAPDIPRAKPVEAYPLVGDTARIFELAAHTIEYRGRLCEVIAIRDLTEKRAAQRRIEYLARHDALTGIPNRTLFHERVTDALERSRGDHRRFSVLALDLDRFKVVNDLFGHAEGDRVLKQVATILEGCAFASDTVARIGGDEFCILQLDDEQPDAARTMAERILTVFREQMDFTVDPTAVGVSIGIATYPQDGTDHTTLTHAADLALYRAKIGGRGTYAFYDHALDLETRERRQMENDLRQAIGRGEFHLAYQEVRSVETEAPVAYEALLRWRHPERGDVPADVFIPVAEETGTIIAIGEWALREACRTASRWSPELRIAVNISPVQFRLANLAFVVSSILDETGLDPHRLELEITEAALLKDRQQTLETLRQLKALGISIVMDDFGTGYSSLSNLKSFPFDKLKIDRTFIAAMARDDNARAIVRAVVGLGRSLDLPVTAEGIETLEQYRLIAAEGCEHVQGFLFGKPLVTPVPARI